MARKTNRRVLDIPEEITAALDVPPVEYLRRWWMANSTEAERTTDYALCEMALKVFKKRAA